MRENKKMEKKAKRVFDKEFRINTARLIVSKEKKIAELSGELGINENTLHMWKNQYLKDTKDAFPGKGHQTPDEGYLKECSGYMRRTKAGMDRPG
jgi:transposase